MGRSTAVAMSGSGNSRTSVRCPRLPETLLDPSGGDADTPRPFAGEVPERLKGLVSKTSVGLVLTVGSNPTLSASLASRDLRRGSRRFNSSPGGAQRPGGGAERSDAEGTYRRGRRTSRDRTTQGSLRPAVGHLDLMDSVDGMDPRPQSAAACGARGPPQTRRATTRRPVDRGPLARRAINSSKVPRTGGAPAA